MTLSSSVPATVAVLARFCLFGLNVSIVNIVRSDYMLVRPNHCSCNLFVIKKMLGK